MQDIGLHEVSDDEADGFDGQAMPLLDEPSAAARCELGSTA